MVPTTRSSWQVVIPFPADKREQSLSRRSLRLAFSCKEMQNIVLCFFSIELKDTIVKEQFLGARPLSVIYEFFKGFSTYLICCNGHFASLDFMILLLS